MDIGTIFIGIVLLVVAWACWTYLPHPIGILAGLIFGLVGLYFILVGLTEGVHGGHIGTLLPFLGAHRMRRYVLQER